MRIVASPRGTGNLAHLLVLAAQLVKRASSGVREKYASHNNPSVARAATPSGLKGLCWPLVSGNLPITFSSLQQAALFFDSCASLSRMVLPGKSCARVDAPRNREGSTSLRPAVTERQNLILSCLLVIAV